MALTKEFVDAVSQGKLLRVRIMLKDSLLVDTSFELFNEMLRYTEPRLKELWVSDEEDEDVFSQSPDELNLILVGLVTRFSKRRVKHLMGMISTMYPSKTKPNNCGDINRETGIIIKKTKAVVKEFFGLQENKRKINEVCSSIVSKKQIDISDIAAIRNAARNIIEHCDKISGK